MFPQKGFYLSIWWRSGLVRASQEFATVSTRSIRAQALEHREVVSCVQFDFLGILVFPIADPLQRNRVVPANWRGHDSPVPHAK